jgi:hypothetical protein
MKTLMCKQGSTEWSQARVGIPTASEFDAIITPLGKPRTSEGRQTYLLEKVAERLLGYPRDTGSSYDMTQGSIIETIARPWYEFQYDVKVQQVGLCTTDDGRVGCSPDGLLGDDGGIEIKSPSAHVHLSYLLAGVVPPQYVAQVQGCLWVTGRAWWQFVSYSRFFPPLVLRIEPDPAFQAALGKALAAFLVDFDAALAKIRAMMPEPTDEGGRA